LVAFNPIPFNNVVSPKIFVVFRGVEGHSFWVCQPRVRSPAGAFRRGPHSRKPLFSHPTRKGTASSVACNSFQLDATTSGRKFGFFTIQHGRGPLHFGFSASLNFFPVFFHIRLFPASARDTVEFRWFGRLGFFSGLL